jgi:hypothetical protein
MTSQTSQPGHLHPSKAIAVSGHSSPGKSTDAPSIQSGGGHPSRQVSISGSTGFKELPGLIKALEGIHFSMQVRLQGNAKQVKSAIEMLNASTEIYSAQISIRGTTKPSGS